MTISDYLIDLRLEHAAELLANTSMSALEVCSAVGYDSFSYLIKQFKKKYGVTPHKYRSNTAKKSRFRDCYDGSENILLTIPRIIAN